jgi:hypothetical protein
MPSRVCGLSLAAVREGKDRAEEAKLGGMDRQTLRDWVRRFNAEGPLGLGVEPRHILGLLRISSKQAISANCPGWVKSGSAGYVRGTPLDLPAPDMPTIVGTCVGSRVA